MPKDFDDRIEEMIDRVEYLPKGQGGAIETFIREGSPWKPEDPNIVAIRVELRAIAEQLRSKAKDMWYLSPKQKRAIEAAASTVERAI